MFKAQNRLMKSVIQGCTNTWATGGPSDYIFYVGA